MLGYSVNKFV